MHRLALEVILSGPAGACGQRVIALACAPVTDGEHPDAEAFHAYVRCDAPVDSQTLQLLGITPQQLESAPTFPELVEQLVNLLQDAEVFVHHSDAAVAALSGELQRAVGEAPNFGVHRFVDTLRLARVLYPGESNALNAFTGRAGGRAAPAGAPLALARAWVLADAVGRIMNKNAMPVMQD